MTPCAYHPNRPARGLAVVANPETHEIGKAELCDDCLVCLTAPSQVRHPNDVVLLSFWATAKEVGS